MLQKHLEMLCKRMHLDYFYGAFCPLWSLKSPVPIHLHCMNDPSECFFLCSTEENQSHMFQTTWMWVNENFQNKKEINWTFLFGLKRISLKIFRHHDTSTRFVNLYEYKWSGCTVQMIYFPVFSSGGEFWNCIESKQKNCSSSAGFKQRDCAHNREVSWTIAISYQCL